MTKAQIQLQAQIKKIEKEMWFIFNLPAHLIDEQQLYRYKQLEKQWINLLYN